MTDQLVWAWQPQQEKSSTFTAVRVSPDQVDPDKAPMSLDVVHPFTRKFQTMQVYTMRGDSTSERFTHHLSTTRMIDLSLPYVKSVAFEHVESLEWQELVELIERSQFPVEVKLYDTWEPIVAAAIGDPSPAHISLWDAVCIQHIGRFHDTLTILVEV